MVLDEGEPFFFFGELKFVLECWQQLLFEELGCHRVIKY